MPENQNLRLSELAAKVEHVLQNAFYNMQFWVIADVTNHNHKLNTNYHSFDLVEKTPGKDTILAKFSASAWGDGSRELALFETRTGQKFTSNIQVLLRVKVNFHVTYGLRLEVTGIDPNFTLGVIEQQRQKTLEKLCRENPQYVQKRGDEYWTKNKGLLLPLVIQRVAVVCATGSAGWQDFHHTLENNHFNYKFKIVPFFTQVQGEVNAAAMQATLVTIYQSVIPFDVIVLIRGGGAQTDFLIFDHYLVGRAIARIPIPVITGIGHQKNTTIADQMAHTSVKTPTKSAEFIISHNRNFEEKLIMIQKNLLIKVQQNLSSTKSQLDRSRTQITNSGYVMLATQNSRINAVRQVITGKGRSIPYDHRIALANVTAKLLSQPKILVAARKNDLESRIANINYFQKAFLANTRGFLNHSTSYFKTISLESTLKRGFGVISYKGKIISDPGLLKKGDDFSVIMKETELIAVLQNKKPYDGN